MTNHLWLPQPTAAPTPTEFAGYLRQRGWVLGNTNERWSEFSRPMPGDNPWVIEVPQLAQAPDYPRAARVVLDNLSRIEDRDGTQILRDIKAVATDIVRLRIDSPVTRDGRIPVEAGYRVYEAARDMLLAAACSVGDPRPAFPRRKTTEAMDLVRRARFGRAETGSFVLAIECDVPQPLQDGERDQDDTDAPLERQTCARLAQGLAGLAVATREAANTASIEPFRRRVQEGVSANLCEALADILDASGADSLWTSFSFASHRPLRQTPPEHLRFGVHLVGELREAARRLRETAIWPSFEILGPVTRLDSTEPDKGGTVLVFAEIDGRGRHLSLQLDRDEYRRAIDAHSQRSLLRAVGTVRKEGKFWVLDQPRDLEIVQER